MRGGSLRESSSSSSSEPGGTPSAEAQAILPDSPLNADGRWLLKLHGSVDGPEKIVLTRSDFLDMPRQYGALMGLVQGLLFMRHMMFVGYSLQDGDFHEVIHEVRAARGGLAVDGGRGTVLTLLPPSIRPTLRVAGPSRASVFVARRLLAYSSTRRKRAAMW